MARMTTDAPARPTGNNGGVQYTEAEKADYERKQQRAFRNFAKYFQGQSNPKARLPFRAKVVEMSDEAWSKTDIFGTRMVSTVKVELTDAPIAGIRFNLDVTDNPDTVKNPDSALNHLYYAATGIMPPVTGRFGWDTVDIIGKEVNALIERGNDRDDGKRGGLYSALRDFAPLVVAPTFEDDEDEAATEFQFASAAPAKRAPARQKQVPAQDPELDDGVPF